MTSVVALLERAGDLARLDQAVELSRSGRGRAVAIVGPPGIGKTGLLAEAARRARARGLVVLAASGGELETELPFGVVRQLFDPALRFLAPGEREAVMSGSAALVARVLGAERGGSGSLADADAALHGLYSFVSNICTSRPLVLAIDDAHWMDAASLRFALFLLRRLSDLRVAMFVALRSGEPHADTSLVARLIAHSELGQIQPAPLSERAVAQIVGSELEGAPDERFVGACRNATGGVPFLVHALVAELRATGVEPTAASAAGIGEVGLETVARAMMLRLGRFGPAAVSLARAVAVLGADADLPRVAKLAGIGEEEALSALDGLVADHVLQAGRPVRFLHPLLRAAVYDALGPGERSRLHAGAVELLAAEGYADDVVARHVLATEPSGRLEVIVLLRAAARAAGARGAPDGAVVYLRRALEERPPRALRAELLLELGLSEKLVRDPACAEHLDQARGLLTDPAARARVAWELADVLTWAGMWEQALAVIEAGIAEAARTAPELAVRLEALRVNNSLFDSMTAGEVDRRVPMLRRAIAQGTASRDVLLVLACVDVMRGDRIPAAVGLVERALDDGRAVADEGSGSQTLTRALVALSFADELERVEQLLDVMSEDARRHGSVFGSLVVSGFRACVAGRRGELRTCGEQVRRAVELAQEHELTLPLVFSLWYGTEAMVERAELADIADLALSLQLPVVHERTLTGGWLDELRGRLLLARGARRRAVSELTACGQVVGAVRMHPGVSSWRSTLALAIAADDPIEARRLAQSELSDARRVALPRSIGIALRTLGLLEGDQTGIERLRESEQVLRDSFARLEHARTLVELGAALRRGNERAAARAPLRAGLDLAHRCGATKLCEHALTELAATGARPRRTMITGRDSLTPTEHRIATMAAQGMSNREIANALFVTLNTVQGHLRHVYRKLSITARTQLAAALTEAGERSARV
ncbi:MAG: ATP-binding protein [Solirubrobacteraceae bacterium]